MMQMQWGTLKQRIPFGLIIAAIAGLALGLLVGWVIWPVEYADTDLHSLRDRHQATYVELVADSYAMSTNLEMAQARLAELEGPGRTAEDVAAYVGETGAKLRDGGNAEAAERVLTLARAVGAAVPTPEPVVVAPTPEPTPVEGPADSKSGGIVRTCLGALFVVLILVGLALIVSYVLSRRRSSIPRPMVPSRELDLEGSDESGVDLDEWTPGDVEWDGAAESLALGHFVTTFELGDDGYDESFGIETETGEFLGECGVAISEVIGSGSEKPTAFDIWLFDKSDIRTVTTVAVSAYANNDDALRAKLGAKGDVVLAKRGQIVVLETATLQVRAEIIDLSYGSEGDLPDESFFAKFTVELSPTTKPATV